MAGDKQNGRTTNSRMDQGKWKGFEWVGGMAEGDGSGGGSGTGKLLPEACEKAVWVDLGDAVEQGDNGVGDGLARADVAGGIRRRGLFALTDTGRDRAGRLVAGGQDPGGM